MLLLQAYVVYERSAYIIWSSVSFVTVTLLLPYPPQRVCADKLRHKKVLPHPILRHCRDKIRSLASQRNILDKFGLVWYFLSRPLN